MHVQLPLTTVEQGEQKLNKLNDQDKLCKNMNGTLEIQQEENGLQQPAISLTSTQSILTWLNKQEIKLSIISMQIQPSNTVE